MSAPQGTIFRVFDTVNGNKLCELRRGYSTYASIKCMSFNVRGAGPLDCFS